MAEVVESVVLRPTEDGYEANITLKNTAARPRRRPGTRKLWLRGPLREPYTDLTIPVTVVLAV